MKLGGHHAPFPRCSPNVYFTELTLPLSESENLVERFQL